MCDTENLTPEQIKDVHLEGTRELEDDDELYDFDRICFETPEEVINVDGGARKPEGPFSSR